VPITTDILRDGVDALKAALATERQARQEAEARATGAEAMVAHLKLVIRRVVLQAQLKPDPAQEWRR